MFLYEGCTKFFDDEFINLMKEQKCEEVLSRIKIYRPEVLVDSDGNHLLHLLAKFNNIEVIEWCIKSDYSLHVEDKSGNTPMMVAVLHGNSDAARLFLDEHVDTRTKRWFDQNYLATSSDPQLIRFSERLIPIRLKMQIKDGYMRDIVPKLREKGWNSKQIGEILARLRYDLVNVVRLHDAVVTEAFLHCKPYNGSPRLDLNDVVATFDWRHINVLINHKPSLMHLFIHILMNSIAKFHGIPDGREFLRHVLTWEVLNENSLEHFEKCLLLANKENVTVFLEYGFHAIAEEKCGQDITAALFANPNVNLDILLKIDVDKRYHRQNTALHIAARCSHAKNIRSLLNMGADPNALNDEQHTPLRLAVQTNYLNEECVKLLLISGADLAVVSDYLVDKFSSIGARELPRDSNMDAMKHFAAHLAVMEALDLPIKKLVSVCMNFGGGILRYFFEKCRRQVNELKTYTVRDVGDNRWCSVFTMFTILAESPEKIAHLLKEEDVKLIHELLECKKKSWQLFYSEALEEHVGKIIKINRLRDRATLYTCLLTGIENSQHLVIQKIVHQS